MSLFARIIGKNKQQADVVEGGLLVSAQAAPSPVDEQVMIPYAEVMTLNNDGETMNLNVDGSATSVRAYIEAESGVDIYIKQVSILVEAVVGGNGMQLNMFGGIVGGLTEGLVPFLESKNVLHPISERPIKTNFDLVRIGSLTPAIGVDDSAFRIKNGKTSASWGYLSRWDVTQLSSGTDGLPLQANTKQKFGVIIQDDLLSLGALEIFVLGFRRAV